MYSEKQHSGLNGFWGNLWGGFKSVFTSTTGDDSQSSTVGKIGRRLGLFLQAFVSASTGGIVNLKTDEYIPTVQELAILNPLTTTLNNYMIAMVNSIDAFFLSNSNTTERINFLNNAIRKIQIIQGYFFDLKFPGLSPAAQHL